MEHLIFYVLTYYIVEYKTERFTYKVPRCEYVNAKKSALDGGFVIALIAILTLVYILGLGDFLSELNDMNVFLIQCFFDLLIIVIVISAVVYRKENLRCIGIMKQDLLKSCILGTSLGILFFILCIILAPDNYSFEIISVRSLLSLIEFSFVGFAEEISFRGYLQSRLIAWKGIQKGVWITAIVFSFWHLPVNLVFKGIGMENAIFSCILLIPLSLLLGHIMLKTRNIAAVVILHTIMDWVMNT